MDFYRNVTFAGDHPPKDQVSASPCSMLPPLDDLLTSQNTEIDVGMEWLSVFVEDCLSSTGNCLPKAPTNTQITPNPSKPKPRQKSLKKSTIPSKARSKRKRVKSYKTRNPLSSWCTEEPPLLHHQAYWMADSELIVPKKETKKEVEQENEEGGRKCRHCFAQKTPQWRAGPMGPKTLCNACGVRYKSGRLYPEYRPAKSPSFVTFLHSNSHKKVLQIRNSSA